MKVPLAPEEPLGEVLWLVVVVPLGSFMVSFNYTFVIKEISPKFEFNKNKPVGSEGRQKMFKVVIDMPGIRIPTVTRPYMFSDIF